mgnify:FL=1
MLYLKVSDSLIFTTIIFKNNSSLPWFLMSKNKKIDFKKYFNLRNVIIGLLVLFISLLYSKYLAGIILIIIFAPLSMLIIRYSRMIPHVSADSNLAMSCLMGVLFGPVFGLLYGLIVGLFAYGMNSFIRITSLSTILLAALSGFFCSILVTYMHFPFITAFIIIVLARTVVAWPLFSILGTDPFENFTHQLSQLLFNLIIYLPILTILYNLISPVI